MYGVTKLYTRGTHLSKYK